MRRVENPANGRAYFVRIVRPKLSHTLRVNPLCREPILWWIHRIEKRSVVCEAKNCEFCDAKQPIERRVYLPCFEYGLQETVFVDLPESCWSLLMQYSMQGASLQDWSFKMQRGGDRENGPVWISVIGQPQEKRELWDDAKQEKLLADVLRENTEYARNFLKTQEKRSHTIARGERSGEYPTPDMAKKIDRVIADLEKHNGRHH